ncbi:hypothetical protein PIB30_032868 [Stylosanthes scabra]|uniref:HMA domain-containing protein n=1 Tax=Stylosanthes scabra TaxID=79078 RepID=A0ABU6SCG5_9FABA|nr:hypothetical protein [Stylosanthes scabra]
MKRSGGFMCHSEASTAVCMSYRNVVEPTRRHIRSISLGDTTTTTSLINYAAKLVDNQNSQHQQQIIQPHKTATEDNVFQVVVMRVAIHCQGCAGKVKKHLSKMEGVTSFSIDVESKRVTVMGHISPVEVLESISKVKRAEFWNC